MPRVVVAVLTPWALEGKKGELAETTVYTRGREGKWIDVVKTG